MAKVPQKYKDFVKECARQAAWHIGVSHFELDIEYMADQKSEDCKHEVTQGEMKTDRRYLHGTLRLYPVVLKNWEKGEKDQVKKVVYHEIAHLATQHIFDIATSCYKDEGETKDAWESLTEVISRMALIIDGYARK